MIAIYQIRTIDAFTSTISSTDSSQFLLNSRCTCKEVINTTHCMEYKTKIPHTIFDMLGSEHSPPPLYYPFQAAELLHMY